MGAHQAGFPFSSPKQLSKSSGQSCVWRKLPTRLIGAIASGPEARAKARAAARRLTRARSSRDWPSAVRALSLSLSLSPLLASSGPSADFLPTLTGVKDAPAKHAANWPRSGSLSLRRGRSKRVRAAFAQMGGGWMDLQSSRAPLCQFNAF